MTMSPSETKCFDPGKTRVKVVSVQIAPQTRAFQIVGRPFSKAVPPLNTLADVYALITDELHNCGAPLSEAIVAMTFPLPVVDGLIQGRDGMKFFDKKTPGAAEDAIRTGLRL